MILEFRGKYLIKSKAVSLFILVAASWVNLDGAALKKPGRSMGPWNNDLWITQSNDGLEFGQARRFVERGGVPSLAVDQKGRLVAVFQWFPFDQQEAFDRVAVMISSDNAKTWTKPQAIEIKNFPSDYQRAFDPTLVLLDDGRLRLYFTSTNDENRTPSIYSAISNDGIHYVFEPGVRFSADLEAARDCAVFQIKGSWHLLVPADNEEGVAYRGISKDGLNFSRQADLLSPKGGRWLGVGLRIRESVRFYGSDRGIWAATTKDGHEWSFEKTIPIQGADPGVARAPDGRYFMIYTGPMRNDPVEGPSWLKRPRPRPPEIQMEPPEEDFDQEMFDEILREIE